MRPEFNYRFKNLPVLGTFAAVLFITVIAAGYFFSNNQLEKTVREAKDKLDAVGHLKQAQLSQWLKERMGDCGVIKANPITARRFSDFLNDPGKESELKSWMNARLESYGYENIFFFDSNRKLRIRTGADEESTFGQEFYSRLEKAAAANVIVFSGLYQTSGTGNDIDFIIPLPPAPGTKTSPGFIVLRSDPESYIYPLLARKTYFYKTIETILVEYDQGERKIFVPGENGYSRVSGKTSFISRIGLIPESDSVIEAEDYRNEPVIASLNRVEGSSWYIVTKVDRAEIYAPVERQRTFIFIIAGLIVIGASGGAGLLWHSRQANLYKSLYKEQVEKEIINEELLKTELKFKNLIENNSDVIALVSAEGIILYESPAIEKVLGYKQDELKGTNSIDLLHPDEKNYAIELLEEIISEPGKHLNAVVRTRHKNGSWRFIEFDVKNQLQNEAVNAVIINYRDVTMRINAERRLKESEILYRTLASNFPDGAVFLFDHELRFLIAEGSYLQDYPRMEGKTIREIFSPELCDSVEPDYRAALKGESRKKEIVDGGKVFLMYTLPIVAADGSIPMGMIVSRDITEIKNAESKIRELNTNLEKKIRERTHELETVNSELEAFAYSVSHDLRAPLRSIDGFSQALVEDYLDSLDETGRDYLSRVRAASQRMGKLIDDILSLSRITRRELDVMDVNLSEIVTSISEELRKMSPGRDVEFIVAEDLCTRGDRVLLQAALNNLLENAFKFTSKIKSARIEFGCTRENGRCVYYVKDNGAGFDMKYADKLFTPFQRLHTVDEFPGTGIGLANVQKVIRRHGGDVWVESERNRGAAFYFTLYEKYPRNHEEKNYTTG